MFIILLSRSSCVYFISTDKEGDLGDNLEMDPAEEAPVFGNIPRGPLSTTEAIPIDDYHRLIFVTSWVVQYVLKWLSLGSLQ